MSDVIFMQENVKVVDGKDKVLGRVASQVAKMLLKGDKVVTDKRRQAFHQRAHKISRPNTSRSFDFKDKANPEHSPYWSRRPDLFVKRVVRGMLPYKNQRQDRIQAAKGLLGHA